MEGISKKVWITPALPSEEDQRSDQERIIAAVREQLPREASTPDIYMPLAILRRLYPFCEQCGWNMTVVLAFDGCRWEIVDLEPGNTVSEHLGLAIDLGSTSVVGRLLDMETGQVLAEASSYNGQIRYGTDILSRIFYCKDDPDKLEEIRQVTLDSIQGVCRELGEKSGRDWTKAVSMTVGANTTMVHFLLGMDPFCVFMSPYCVRASAPDFLRASEVGFDLRGYVYCFPSRANYLGGDILSGMIATQIYREERISAFFDIGTNGELVIGSRDFLLCGAGAAGPALEGGVVHTGMRAAEGAVERVKLENGEFKLEVIGGGQPKGICGSGIIDLIAELFLHGWIDFRGTIQEKAGRQIQWLPDPREEEGEGRLMAAVEYAPGMFFYQCDIDEFIRTKAAAFTMVDYMLSESGISPDELGKFYVCGAFGKHVSKESAIAIGMYPDMEREAIINAGNSSLEGAQMLLLNRHYLEDIDYILENMTYIQYGAVDNFLERMQAALCLPHLNLELYPSVREKLNAYACHAGDADLQH